MKKLLLFSFLICLVSSCGPKDDNSLNFYYETLPIESVDMPDEFVFGSTYQITMTYLKPSNCHLFNDFYYVSEQNQRTIAIITTVFPDQDCQIYNNQIEEVSFNFQVNSIDQTSSFEPYVFRFWQGEDENGNDTYYVIEVPVVE